MTAQEEERRSIARELHDEVGQVLTAIKVELAVAQRAIEARGGQPDALADVRRSRTARCTVRDLSHLLHPAMLDDLGLAAAIDWYPKGFSRRHGVKIELLQDRMEERLTADTEAVIYRIVQEALTNVAKHAQATTCRVYLQRLTTAARDDRRRRDRLRAGRAEAAGAPRGIGLLGTALWAASGSRP